MIHIHWASRFMFLQVAWAITITCKSPQWSLFFKVCQKLFFFYPPPLCWVLSVKLGAAKMLHDCPEAHFPLSSDRCKHPLWDRRPVSSQICQLCPGLNQRRCVPGGGVFPGGRRLQKLLAKVEEWVVWGGGGCSTSQTWSWSLVFTKDVESPLKACGVPWEMVGFGWF